MDIIQYQETFGPVRWQEGFEQELAGRTPEEQRRCYALTERRCLCDVPYRQVEETARREGWKLEPVSDRWSVIMKEDTVAGFAYSVYRGLDRGIEKKPLLPYGGYVYDSTSDNNGSGYKTRDWYKYLVCLPCDHGLW